MRSCAFPIMVLSGVLLTFDRGLTADPRPDEPIPVATKKGADFLIKAYRPRADYTGGSNGMGTACLGGLALLDSGVDEKNLSVQNIIRFVRRGSQNEKSTYNLALSIMFLDRLGDPGDVPLIQFLAIRLMTGQCEGGGWSYECGLALSAEQEATLTKVFANESKLIRIDPLSKKAKEPSPEDQPRKDIPAPKKDGIPELHPVVGKLFNQMQIVGGGGGDNSNTQFATLGLWCARKYGVPVDKSMKALEKWFRNSQCADGGWDYAGNSQNSSTPAMSCAGLIALAVTYGASESVLRNKLDAPRPVKKKSDRVDLGADEAVTNGLKGLGAHLAVGMMAAMLRRIPPFRRS